jgi:uncharacterized membrane protein
LGERSNRTAEVTGSIPVGSTKKFGLGPPAPRFWGIGLATLDIVSVASDIADAGTALAGLILVYLGAVAVRYETLDPKNQSSARDAYRRHARRAFRGIVIALVAAIAALTAESLKSGPYATIIALIACIALLMSFFIAVMAAYWILKSLDDAA